MERSPKFNTVKDHFEAHRWNETMVRNAAKNPPGNPWITEAEAEEIIGGGAQEDAVNE